MSGWGQRLMSETVHPHVGSPGAPPAPESAISDAQRFAATARAFDSVAATYDGPAGNNALVQIMRSALWGAVESRLSPPAQLLELGCGTGIDAEHFARRGFRVHATDWSPRMMERTRARVAARGLGEQIQAEKLGIHELDQFRGGPFDGIYSDLGPLNCVTDLEAVADSSAALLKPRGWFIASVIGRVCPWEFFYYALRGQLARARLRAARETVPVNLNYETVWTQYYSPGEFYAAFSRVFQLVSYRGLNLFLPPPYLIRWYERAQPLFAPLAWLDRNLDGLPVLRHAGDHFLMVLQKRQ